jgi:iron complex outermembrane recepter protein
MKMIETSATVRRAYFKTMLATGIAFGALLSSPAFAQSNASPPPQTADDKEGLGEIIVTATKRSENLQDVPVSISAIGAEQLQTRGVTTSNDLGQVVPNLQVSSQYGETSPNFSLRGVGVTNEFTANTASPIGVYVDEVNQTFRYTHGLSLYDLERVEVLRGPQGTLFGRNTTGGAVNIITRQPQLGAPNGYVSAGYGNYDRFTVQGAAEVSPVEDKVGLRLAFNYGKGDGYFKDPQPSRNGISYGTLDTLGLRGILRVKPSDKLNISIKGFYNKDNPVGYSLHYIGLVGRTGPGTGTDFFGSTRNGQVLAGGVTCCSYGQIALDKGGHFLTKAYGGAVNINYEVSDQWSLTSVTGYTKSKYNLDIDNDGTPQDVYFIFYRSKGKDFSEDFRINFDSDSVKGLLGFFYGNDSLDTNNLILAYNVLPDAPANLPPAQWAPGVSNSFNVSYGFVQKRKTFAVYGEATVNITPKLELTGGLRYTKDKLQYGNGYSRPITDFPGSVIFTLYENFGLKNSYSNVSGRAIVNYAWTDEFKTYASFSRGYRSGSYNGFGFVTTSAVYFVKPEKLDSIEVGFKSRFLDNRLQLNGAAFRYDYKNQQVSEVRGGLAFPQNVNAKVKGAELELLAKPVSALTLRGSIGYLDTRYTSNNPCLSPTGIATTACPGTGGTSIVGNQIPFASKFTLSFGGDLTLGEVAGGKIVLSGEAAYKSKFWYDFFNDNARPAAVVNNGVGGVTQLYPGGKTDLVGSKAYTLINANLAWNSDNISVRVYGKNVFNKKYYPFGYDTAGAFGTVLLTPGTPRTYGVEATFRF